MRVMNLRWQLLIVLSAVLLSAMFYAFRANADNYSTIGSPPLNSVASENAVTSTSNNTVATAADGDDKGFWLTIRPTGFEVKEMTIPAGDYFVVVQNATGLNRFSLRVESESGLRLYDLRFPKFQKYWKQMVHLVPGRYVISESDHPDWICRITVN